MEPDGEKGADWGAKTGQAYLRIEGATKRFDDTLAVDDVSLAIAEREIFALLGSSGCGKSTLLRMLAGLEVPDAGRIVLDGEDLAAVPAHRRPTNMMFQSYALFPHMTVEANVAFGLWQERPRLTRAEVGARVAEMLELVQMQRYARRKPHELSGGQQQRVALARSLAKEPKLLLLDEPLAALDKKIRQRTQLELVNLIERVGVTCILVTHDQEEAMTMAGRIGVMSEGRLLQVGTPGEIYETPNCRFTAEFIGETNLFRGRVAGGALACGDFPAAIVLPPDAALAAGDEVWVSVRPERVTLSRAGAASSHAPGDANCNAASGEVADIAYLGSHSVYHVRLANGRVVIANVPSVHWGDAPSPTWGDAVRVAWFAPDGVVLTR
ncbi:polyamine ABC transporter ATP-binding protein [Aromatoleum toluolicum]|uniref:Spermidine/putrescine import ATP-binding protein PotA n=1 Tax=Aromatoleum toluolicum TaxID=90060 RepID=A0ABX1NMS1_9RHOO|nr:polyamine ABC transporter ATP-binding protein [Aromatoleum toluolicum]NMG00617.1 polyamine ABC transporter ATP-binding protein [Aromatoleum toluolicum]